MVSAYNHNIYILQRIFTGLGSIVWSYFDTTKTTNTPYDYLPNHLTFPKRNSMRGGKQW